MKKIMIALGAVACAAAVQAASVNWNFDVSATDSGFAPAVGSVVVSALSESWTQAFNDAGVAPFSVSGTTDDVFAAGTQWKVTTTATLVSDDGTQTKDYTFDYIFTMPSLPTDDPSIQSALAGVADDINNALSGTYGTLPSIEAAEAEGWTPAGSSVPEPTSGLLLLLGVAGLALRRKHA